MGESKRRKGFEEAIERGKALKPEVVEAQGNASDSDREWFEANPHRNFRIRALMDNEDIGGAKPADYIAVIVRQLKPGGRLRLIVDLKKPWWRHDKEETIRDIWQEAELHNQQIKEVALALK